MTQQVFNDSRMEEMVEFIKDELDRLLFDDSPMGLRIQKRFGRLTTAERLVTMLWASNNWQANIILKLATLDTDDMR